MTSSPSSIARTNMLSRLTDPTYGFNSAYATISPKYPLAKPIVIDFSTRSQNFFQTRLGIENIIGSSSYRLPLMVMYVNAGANQNLQKFQSFAGLLTASIEMYLDYKKTNALQSTEDWPDAVEETIMTVFNRPETQNWPNTLMYNGQISFERRPLAEAGSNWLQSIYFRLTFEAVVK